MSVGSSAKKEAKTSSNGDILLGSYAGGGWSLMFGQDVFSSTATRDDDALSFRRNSWILVSIS